MRPDETQYLPNDNTLQIDYKPNPQMLDHRGEWTAHLSERLALEHWRITENQVGLFNEGKTEQAYVAFNRCGLSRWDEPAAASFKDRIGTFIRVLFSLNTFPNELYVRRIAVKSRFCTPFRGTFEELLDRIKERYVSLSERALTAIGSSSTLLDIGAPANFEDEHGKFNTVCGAMPRTQSKQFYFTTRDEDDLPEVGLFYDIDYFLCPEGLMGADDAIKKTAAFAQEGWSRHQRIRKLIVGL
ncbi:MAG: hypothetical protein NTW96_19740 [Planctomycetia bacterium]|nr:hypothetical protein [Planctomycetia bacterium]